MDFVLYLISHINHKQKFRLMLIVEKKRHSWIYSCFTSKTERAIELRAQILCVPP